MNVPTYVIQDLELVRQSGKHNMLDSDGVLRELYDLGKYQTVLWLMKDTDSNYVRVDREKYVEALKVLGDTIHLADKLASE